MKAYLNAAEVAKLLHVDRATVSRWIRKGLLTGAIRPTGRQQWRIPLAAYEQLRVSATATALADGEDTAGQADGAAPAEHDAQRTGFAQVPLEQHDG